MQSKKATSKESKQRLKDEFCSFVDMTVIPDGAAPYSLFIKIRLPGAMIFTEIELEDETNL